MSLRGRIVALEAEVGQRTHEGMTPSPDARGAYFLVQLALRAALAADAAQVDAEAATPRLEPARIGHDRPTGSDPFTR